MDSLKQWYKIAAPTGWDDVIIRAIKVAIVVYVVLEVRELLDVGDLDTLANLSDALWIGGGAFVLDAILFFSKS